MAIMDINHGKGDVDVFRYPSPTFRSVVRSFKDIPDSERPEAATYLGYANLHVQEKEVMS